MPFYKYVAPTALGRSPDFVNKKFSCQISKNDDNYDMSLAARTVAEILALPEQERADLARQLIASLDTGSDAGAETEWHEVLDRRGREIEQGTVACRAVNEVVDGLRAKLNARRQPS
jgi:putative addiction module component (TIGR02574 family)